MKSERRHELQHNDLADWTVKAYRAVLPYKNAILGVSVLLLVVIIGVGVWRSRSAAAAAEGWNAMNPPLFAPNYRNTNEQAWAALSKIANDNTGTAAGEWAQITLADSLLFDGENLLMQQPSQGQQNVKSAQENYEKVLATATDSMARQRCLFGKARAQESLGQLQDATTTYQQLNTEFPQGTYKGIADERLSQLSKPEAAEFYKKLAGYKPKPKKEEKSPSSTLEGLTLPDNPTGEPEFRIPHRPGETEPALPSPSLTPSEKPNVTPPKTEPPKSATPKNQEAKPEPAKPADSSKATAPPTTPPKSATTAPAKSSAAPTAPPDNKAK